MRSDLADVSLSAIDEQRFGVRIARAPSITVDNLPGVLDFCHAQRVAMLIARCPASEFRTTQVMERKGFLLMDALLYFARNLTDWSLPVDCGTAHIRPVRPGEEDAVANVAAAAFAGHTGHYHADDRLDTQKATEGYRSWTRQACVSRDVAAEMLVADKDGSIAGFYAMRFNSPQEVEGVIGAVAPAYQRHGIFRSLMLGGMEWSVAQGATRMLASTLITNLGVQKAWVRLGFEPSHAVYTFHKWFDDDQP